MLAEKDYISALEASHKERRMLTGKRKPTICKECKNKVLEKHLMKWKEIKTA